MRVFGAIFVCLLATACANTPEQMANVSPDQAAERAVPGAPASTGTQDAAPSKVEVRKPQGLVGGATNRDRDPAEERRKMSLSRKRSAAATRTLQAGRVDQAVGEAREALHVHEQNVQAMLVLAEAYYKQGKHELAQTVTSTLLAVDPKVVKPDEISRAYNLKGFAYLAQGKTQLATQAFRKAAEGDPKNAAAWNNLGGQYLRAGDSKTAIGCFKYATELDPKFAKAHLNLGAALRSDGQLVAAEQSFRKSLELVPNYAEAHFNMGVLYLDAEALQQLDVVTRLNRAMSHFTKYRELVLANPSHRRDAGVGSPTRRPTRRNANDDDSDLAPVAVSPKQAELYIELAKKGLDREKRRLEREQKRRSDPTPSQPATNQAPQTPPQPTERSKAAKTQAPQAPSTKPTPSTPNVGSNAAPSPDSAKPPLQRPQQSPTPQRPAPPASPANPPNGPK